MKDEILQIIEDTQDEFLGMNEANLHSAERIEKFVESEMVNFFMFFRNNGEFLIGISVEELVKTYLLEK